MSKPSVMVGVVCYGQQSHNWWSKMITFVGTIHHYDIDYVGSMVASSMLTDGNRNLVVREFLNTKAEWLFWIDADNPPVLGALKRLLDTGKTLVSGLYYTKEEKSHPVAYYRVKNGLYASIDKVRKWNPGELFKVDAAGMGCCLTHRSVYEDILKNYTMIQYARTGGIGCVHNSDITGNLDKPDVQRHGSGEVKGSFIKEQVVEADAERYPFPFFMFGHNRTEDLHFFEIAQRVGHDCWIDSSVEVDHVGEALYNGYDYRQKFVIAPLVKDDVHIEVIHAGA